MRRLVLTSLLFLVLAGTASAIDLFIRSPRDGEVVFGPVEIRLEVLSAEPVAEVVVRLDGEVVARITEPPYRTVIDVGEENRDRTFEITVRDVAGETETRSVTTRALAMDFEIDVELQQLYVTVTRDAERVLDLRREDFEITDDGIRQEIVTFERGDVPLTAVLLVDSSLSMRGEQLRSALAGVQAFIADMRELDEAKLIVFSDRTLGTMPFTSDPALVESVLEAASAGGGTALNDHLYLALKELDRRQGRTVVVLLSDGIDVESVLQMRDVAWKAGRMQTLIYWIRPGPVRGTWLDFHSAWRDSAAHREEMAALERIVVESGGRVRRIADIEEAAGAFREILAELREQYVAGYYPSNDRDDGAWHEVRVRLAVSGVEVRARGGYFDDELR